MRRWSCCVMGATQGRDDPSGPGQAPAPPSIWPRQPPIRYRANIPDYWLELSLREGRNRQVRRMTAAVGLPTLRLIRVSVGRWQLAALQPGQYRTETVAGRA